MTRFYTQPYDISADGFHFETEEEFKAKCTNCPNYNYCISTEFAFKKIEQSK